VLARVIQEPLSRRLGVAVVVENRPGAGGAVGAEVVRRAIPDGHVVLLATASTHGVNPAVFDDLPYDAERDFAPIALLGLTPQALAVRADHPARRVADLVALLRAEPGRHNYASAGVGSITHLASEWFLQMAGGLAVQHVPYRGGGPALQAVIAGEATFVLETTATLAGAVQGGRVRLLAVASSRRSAAFPEVPTLQEEGFADVAVGSWTMAVAPAGTPAATIARWNAALREVMADREVQDRLAAVGTEAVTDSTPESAAAHIRADIARWRAVVQQAELRITRG
jgi:tripartite-type tricarboxylate transporter receptor subunit TctC